MTFSVYESRVHSIDDKDYMCLQNGSDKLENRVKIDMNVKMASM